MKGKRPWHRRWWGVLGLAVVATLLITAAIAAILNKALWGFFFVRPGIDARVLSGTTLSTLTPILIQDNGTGRELVRGSWSFRMPYQGPGWYEQEKTAYPHEYDYYLLDRRPLLALERAGAVNSLPPELSDAELQGLLTLVRDSGWLYADSPPGYDQLDPSRACGHIYELERSSGPPLLLIALRGSEVSNDHLPYYEFLYERRGEELKLLSVRRFFFDIAGMEHMEFAAIFAVLSVPALTVTLLITTTVLVGRGLANRSADRRGLCPKCRYDLQYDFARGCPECGWGREA